MEVIKISSKENNLFEAMSIIYDEMATNSDISKYGRITGLTSDVYAVEVEGVTYSIKSQFDFSIGERVLVLSPSGGTEKYLYPNKMGTTGEVVVDAYTKAETDTLLAGKVNTETGKGLSTNDYTTTEKDKLAGIADNANNYVHPPTHSADMIVDGTTNKVLSSTMKTQYDEAYANKHTHANKTALDLVSGTNTGDETVISIGSLISGATEKTTPVDADMVGLMDSTSSNVLKKLSWSHIKATLKNYFDTLYNNYVHPTQSAITSNNSNGVVIQDININNLGHTTSVETVDLDNRYYTETEIDTKFSELPTDSKISKTFTIPASTGWYRIAQSPIDAGQASGLVEIVWNSDDGYEGRSISTVSSLGNTSAVLAQLLCNSSYGNSYIYEMRVVRPSVITGNRSYLEIYLLYAHQTTIEVSIDNNLGWEFLDLETGFIPSGYSYNILVLSRYSPFATSSTSMCSGLNSTYLQGVSANGFQRKYTTTSALPTPSSAYRNHFYWLNETGKDDKLYGCILKDDNSTYEFKEIATTEYVDNAVSSGSSSTDNYDTTTTWDTEETVYTTTWTDGTKNYSSVMTELSDTQYRKQLYVDGVLSEQWDITETTSNITTDYTKF